MHAFQHSMFPQMSTSLVLVLSKHRNPAAERQRHTETKQVTMLLLQLQLYAHLFCHMLLCHVAGWGAS